MAASIKMAVLWVVALCSLVEVQKHFRNIGELPPDHMAQQPGRQPALDMKVFCLVNEQVECFFFCCCSTQHVAGVALCSKARSQCNSHHGSLLAHLFHKESRGLLLHQEEFSPLPHSSQLPTQSLSEDSKMALACSSRVHLHKFNLTTVCVFRTVTLPSTVRTNLFCVP
jgi:hypothetical protein